LKTYKAGLYVRFGSGVHVNIREGVYETSVRGTTFASLFRTKNMAMGYKAGKECRRHKQ
jgi:hypothetical protein